MWEIVDLETDPIELHVVPVNDLLEHNSDPYCLCCPRVTDETADGKVYIHNSYDAREFIEEDSDLYTPNIERIAIFRL